MSSAIQHHIDRFVVVNQQLLASTANSLSRLDASALKSVIDRIADSKPVTAIVHLIENSTAARAEFARKLETLGDFGKMIAGLTFSGLGWALYGSALAMGPLVGVLLMVLGISIALPAVWRLIERKLKEKQFWLMEATSGD